MNSTKRIVLILGDQLDLKGAALRSFDFKTDVVVMIESIPEAKYVWSHKAKIALFLSAMRHFAQNLTELHYPLAYIKNSPLSIVETLKAKIIEEGVTDLICVEPGEWRLKQQIEELARELSLRLEMREDDHFYCSHQEFVEWVADKKELRLEYFYRLMRKRHNILVDSTGNPEGGQWNFDQDNRKPYPKKGPASLRLQSSLSPIHLLRRCLNLLT